MVNVLKLRPKYYFFKLILYCNFSYVVYINNYDDLVDLLFLCAVLYLMEFHGQFFSNAVAWF
jgi:hypothetical protein